MACSSVRLGWLQQNQYMKSPGWIVGSTPSVRPAASFSLTISAVSFPVRWRRRMRFRTWRGPEFSPRETKRRTALYRDARALVVEFGILHTLSLIRDHIIRAGELSPIIVRRRRTGVAKFILAHRRRKANQRLKAGDGCANKGKPCAHFGKTWLARQTRQEYVHAPALVT